MNEFLSLVELVIPIFIIIALGYHFRSRQWLTADADQSLLRLAVNLLLPSLIFDSILGNSVVRQIGSVITAPILGFLTAAGGCAIAWSCARWAGLKGSSEKRTFAFVVGIYNYGYLAIPIAQKIFSRETFGLLLIFNLGVEIAIWTCASALIQKTSGRELGRKIINPPIIAVLLGLAMNYLGLNAHLPVFAFSTLHLLGSCAIPLALLLIGATIYDVISLERWRKESIAIGVVTVILRHGILPLCFFALAYFLPVEIDLKRVLVLQAAMPCAVLPIVIVKHYGGSTSTAVCAAVASSLAAFLTIPLWIHFGMQWLPLKNF